VDALGRLHGHLHLMRVHLCVVGRLRTGPERLLLDDYLARFDRTGRALGLGPAQVTEVEDRKGGGMAAEGALLARAVPEGATLVVLDERGALMTSPEFASRLTGWRDIWLLSSAARTGSTRRCAGGRMRRCHSGQWSGRICWRA